MNKRKITFKKPNYVRMLCIGHWNRRHRLFKIASWEYRYNRIKKERKGTKCKLN